MGTPRSTTERLPAPGRGKAARSHITTAVARERRGLFAGAVQPPKRATRPAPSGCPRSHLHPTTTPVSSIRRHLTPPPPPAPPTPPPCNASPPRRDCPPHVRSEDTRRPRPRTLPQPGADRRRHPRRRPAARPRRGRLRQDPGHHLPHRLAGAGGRRLARAHRRRHLHQQGRRRDARAGRGAARPVPAAHLRRHLPPLRARACCGATASGSASKRDFAILDTTDQLKLVKEAIEAEGLSEKAFTPRSVLSAISSAKNRLMTPDDYRVRGAPTSSPRRSPASTAATRGCSTASPASTSTT